MKYLAIATMSVLFTISCNDNTQTTGTDTTEDSSASAQNEQTQAQDTMPHADVSPP